MTMRAPIAKVLELNSIGCSLKCRILFWCLCPKSSLSLMSALPWTTKGKLMPQVLNWIIIQDLSLLTGWEGPEPVLFSLLAQPYSVKMWTCIPVHVYIKWTRTGSCQPICLVLFSSNYWYIVVLAGP